MFQLPLASRTFTLLVGTLTPIATVQAQGPPVGWVSAIRESQSPIPGSQSQQRATSLVVTDAGVTEYSLEVKVGDPVPHAKSLRVTPSDAAVEVILTDGHRIIVRDQEVPIDNAEEGLGDTRAARTVREFFGWFGERGSRRAYAHSRGDGDAIEVLPGLTSGASHLVAGERTLYVTWLGGRPPFSVMLTDAMTGATLFTQGGILRREISAHVELARGEHRLEVTSGGTKATFAFDVRDAAQLPQLAIAADNDLGEIGTTIWAHELLTTDTAWSLEAFERLYAQASARYRPAIDMIRDLQASAFLDDEH